MNAEQAELLRRRREAFESDEQHQEQIDQLVKFIERMGITPAAWVLKEARQYVRYLEDATRDLAVESADDRAWFCTQMANFIGEYFVQKFSGHWYVNDIVGSRFFARYVVGRFASGGINPNAMIEPFDTAKDYVDSPPPRKLQALLDEVEAALRKA